MIKSGGVNMYPSEIEQALAEDELVEEAVVVGVRDEKWGEAVWAFVAADPSVSGDDLRARLRGRLAGHKIPKKIIVLAASDIPRNVTGKVNREMLLARTRPLLEGQE